MGWRRRERRGKNEGMGMGGCQEGGAEGAKDHSQADGRSTISWLGALRVRRRETVKVAKEGVQTQGGDSQGPVVLGERGGPGGRWPA